MAEHPVATVSTASAEVQGHLGAHAVSAGTLVGECRARLVTQVRRVAASVRCAVLHARGSAWRRRRVVPR